MVVFKVFVLLIISIFLFSIFFLFISFVFFKYIYYPRYSVIFVGEFIEKEKEIDNQLQFPFSKFSSVLSNIFTRKLLHQAFEANYLDIHEPIQPFIKKYPNHFLPYIVDAYLYYTQNNENKAKELFNYAHKLVIDYPDINKSFLSVLPTEEQFFQGIWNAELNEIVNNNIWTVNGPFLAYPNDPSPIDLQCSIVKLKDCEDLIIINPLQFNLQLNSKDIIDNINKLGNVVALITSTASHASAIEQCNKIWPNAKLFGTDKLNKHGKPNLPWCGFLSDNNQLFEPDLNHISIKGQSWNETVFYHNSSKSLLGLTDLGISPKHKYKSWAMVLYCISLGLWRGKSTTPIALQNYQTFMISDREIFRETWAHILLLDIEYLILGHGGLIKGKNNVYDNLQESMKWIINNNIGLSFFEKIYLPPAWFFKMGLPSVFFKIALHKIKN